MPCQRNLALIVGSELLAGNVGSILVELAACWAIVLLVSGIYLWWPRSAAGAAGVLYPRLRQGRQVFWRYFYWLRGYPGRWFGAAYSKKSGSGIQHRYSRIGPLVLHGSGQKWPTPRLTLANHYLKPPWR